MLADLAYANADFIPGAAEYPARWAQAAAEARARWVAEGRARLGLAYGPAPRARYDLFLPESAARGLVVFVHGGYWRAFDRADFSHLAAGALAAGWAAALPSYTLAPEARIAQITQEIARAIATAARDVAGPLVLAGHSAGGHLVARMNARDVALAPDLAARIARIVPISPVSDLRPLLHLALNADLRLDPQEALSESPLLNSARRGIATEVWVGAEERPAFLDQARWLAEGWRESRLRIAPGRHHFDIVEDMERAGTPLMRGLLA